MHRVVIVNMIAPDDRVLRGVLWSTRGAWLVLRDVDVLAPNMAPDSVPGEFIIHRTNIAFMQVPPS